MTNINIHIKPFISFCLTLLLSWPMAGSAANEADIMVPFQLVNGLIILEAEVDGVSGSYLLDTGADAVLIDGQPEQADQILVTPKGDVVMASHQLAQIKIGSFIQHKINARIICLDALKKQLGIDLDGIIGSGYFMPNILIMDFEQSNITISSKPIAAEMVEDLSGVAFKMVNQIPIVEVAIEGKIYDFAMDSGATAHFIDEDVLSGFSSANQLGESSVVLTYAQTAITNQRYVLNKLTIAIQILVVITA